MWKVKKKLDKISSVNNIKEDKEQFNKNKTKINDGKNKSFSYLKINNDTRLLLLRPVLKQTLYQDHEKDYLLNIVSRLFCSNNQEKLSLNLNNSKNSSNSNSCKDDSNNSKKQNKYFFLKDDYSFVRRRKYKDITDKYSLQFLIKKYYKDDNDLLYSRRTKRYKRTKKTNRVTGFREFMIAELNKIDENLNNNFNNNVKENEKIRKKLNEKREEKIRQNEEWDKKFALFKSYIQKLKKMDDLELKHDSLRFIYKINEEYQNNEIIKIRQSKRINEFKHFLKQHYEKRNLINKYFMGQIIFQRNCIFSSAKIFK